MVVARATKPQPHNSSGMVGFERDAFLRLLTTRVVGRRLEYHDRVPSTMGLADALLKAEGAAAAHGAVVLAETQTAGIGRRGRSWESAPAGNLYFSLVWSPAGGSDPAKAMPELVRLNLASGVAVVGATAAAGVPGARIKWPNDVWAGTPPRKLSGTILNFDGVSAAVLGVGINVMQDLSANASATSLATLLNEEAPRGETHDAAPAPSLSREGVLAAFCHELESLMAMSTPQVPAADACTDVDPDPDNGRTRTPNRTGEPHPARWQQALCRRRSMRAGSRTRLTCPAHVPGSRAVSPDRRPTSTPTLTACAPDHAPAGA